MSLIQDALKRQQEENEQADGEQTGGIGASPPPAETKKDEPASRFSEGDTASGATDEESLDPSDQPLDMKVGDESKEHGGPRIWLAVTGLVLLIVVAIGAGAYLVRLAMSKFAEGKVAEVAEQSVPAEDVQPVPEEARRTPVSIAADVAAAHKAAFVEPLDEVNVPPPSEITVPEEARAPEVEEPSPVATVEKPELPPEPPPVATVEKAEPPPEPPSEEKKVLPKMDWPHLRLTAVLAGLEDGQNAARINGRMIAQGDQIEGVTLQDVRDDGVVLRLGHETRFLRMGAALY